MPPTSTRQRLSAGASEGEHTAIDRPGRSLPAILQISEPVARTDSQRPWLARRLLGALRIRMVWGRMERRDGLPLPTTTGSSQARSCVCTAITSILRIIVQSARGQEGGDVLSSDPVWKSAVLNFVCGFLLCGNTNTLVASWLQYLWYISSIIWAMSYCIYLTKGHPATLSEGRRKWFAGLTFVCVISSLYLLQQSPIALPSIAGLITLSTAAALWIQTSLLGPSFTPPSWRTNHDSNERHGEPV